MQLVRNRIPGLVLSTWFTYLVSQNKGVSIWEDDPVNWNELPDIIALESIGEWVGQKSVETSQARAAAFNDGAAESKFIDDTAQSPLPGTAFPRVKSWSTRANPLKARCREKINIGINRGAWADVTNKHINLHLIINVDEKSATLRTIPQPTPSFTPYKKRSPVLWLGEDISKNRHEDEKPFRTSVSPCFTILVAKALARPMWNENSLIWSGLAKVVEPNAQEPTDFRHRYDLSHGCLSPGDGYSRICDPSAGASHGDRNGSRPANEGLGFSHSHQDSNDVDVVILRGLPEVTTSGVAFRGAWCSWKENRFTISADLSKTVIEMEYEP
ncbi:hypothetical protein KEM48_014517 [Puccinia striiformis f. sp. tritici PST-130]|nr:hypothetical protein KEM48_014517 [Puccinia striiformis f. sp. tritici PST-130]